MITCHVKATTETHGRGLKHPVNKENRHTSGSEKGQGNAETKGREIKADKYILCVTISMFYYHMRRLARFGTICTILENMKNTYGGVLPLQFTKSNTLPCVFSTIFHYFFHYCTGTKSRKASHFLKRVFKLQAFFFHLTHFLLQIS